jgi:hypothetical protein
VKAASGDDDQNAPARFFELTAAERRVVLFWIRSVMKTAENPSETTSYGMKHHCEEEAGFYICNGAFKGAMLAASHDPVDPAERNARYLVRPLKLPPLDNPRKQTLARSDRQGEVYTILDTEEPAQAEFQRLRAEATPSKNS